ncbi:DUF3274 domain-containing protein [Orbaceae bacterium ac157xtp]
MATNSKWLTENEIGVPKDCGVPVTCDVRVENPLPCIVILIHGVNDIGEAFENLDDGICKGLNQRLGRNDLRPNTWKVTNTETENFSPRISITEEGFSPVIPFFWGYRPVSKDDYRNEQLAYKERLEKQREKDPELPYDSYWKEREYEVISDKITLKKLNCDKFGNWIDCNFHRNGGPFSNATTCIPDMYGPGFAGETASLGKLGSSDGAKVYDTPHRIYLAFAAHRLANLIKQIREDTEKQDIPINIVAHSQGTIITMLANMILDEQNVLPADCIILAHSPYAFGTTFLEALSKDFALGMQTSKAREETFINFVKIMSEGQKKRDVNFDIQNLVEKGVIGLPSKEEQENYQLINGTTVQYDRLGKNQELFYRDNFGKVYNYFSPNDHVVSLLSVQGMGWQGIPNEIIDKCENNNLKQRIFSHHYIVGNNTRKTDYAIPLNIYQILENEYPTSISVKDYEERQKNHIVNVSGENINLQVPLLQDQINELKSIPFFKQRLGKIIYGYYKYNSLGRSIIVHYNPTKEEFEKNNPSKIYYNVTSTELDEACYKTEKEQLIKNYRMNINNDSLNKDDESSINMLDEAAQENCDSLSTKGLSKAKTASYSQTRTVNGEAIPEPFIYKVDESGAKSELSRAIHYNDSHNNGKLEQLKKVFTRIEMQTPEWMPRPKMFGEYTPMYKREAYELVYIEEKDEAVLQKLAQEQGWDRGVYKVQYMPFSEPNPIDGKIYNLLVDRYLTHAELKAQITNLIKEKDESSHHSGITMSNLAPKHVMAYDLALGVVPCISPKQMNKLREWRNLADWRSLENTNKETVQYRMKGELPPKLKRAMGYPHLIHMPKTVVNEFYSINFSVNGQVKKEKELSKNKYSLLSTWPNDPQFPLPDLD